MQIDLKIYSNGGYESSPPDYVFGNLEFICTCCACPEQYDVVLLKDGERYKVGYVRLRGGGFRVNCPACGGEEVYHYHFTEDGWKGCFDNEEERLEHLGKAAEAVQGWLAKEV